MEGNVELQQDEILALRSIFGEEIVDSVREDSVCLTFPSIDSNPSIRIVLYFPAEYPSDEPPIAEISSPVLDESVIVSMETKLQDMFVAGQVVGFEWLAWVQEQWDAMYSTISDTYKDKDNEEGEEEEEENDEQPSVSLDQDGMAWNDMYHGDVLVEKRSKFQAHVASIASVDEVERVMNVLLQNSKVFNATHNIMAYRVESDRGNMHQDFDDDGESAAGKRLLHLLQVMDQRNIIVVVSRWYGGIKLGPARFACINNAARVAIEDYLSSNNI